jgi:hypothetical protein
MQIRMLDRGLLGDCYYVNHGWLKIFLESW